MKYFLSVLFAVITFFACISNVNSYHQLKSYQNNYMNQVAKNPFVQSKSCRVYESTPKEESDLLSTTVEENSKPASTGFRVFGLKLTDPSDLLTIFLSGVIAFNFLDLAYIYGKRLFHL